MTWMFQLRATENLIQPLAGVELPTESTRHVHRSHRRTSRGYCSYCSNCGNYESHSSSSTEESLFAPEDYYVAAIVINEIIND